VGDPRPQRGHAGPGAAAAGTGDRGAGLAGRTPACGRSVPSRPGVLHAGRAADQLGVLLALRHPVVPHRAPRSLHGVVTVRAPTDRAAVVRTVALRTVA